MNNDKAAALAACPFCGGAVKIFGGHNNGAAAANCTVCDAYGPSVPGKDAATTAWNRRAQPAQPVAAQPEGIRLDPVVEANRDLLRLRSQIGIRKYGVTLGDANLSERELTTHALEEALDLSNYLQAKLQRIDAAAQPAVDERITDTGVNLDVIKRAYAFHLDIHGNLMGLVAGDMGYEETGITLEGHDLEAWKAAMDKPAPMTAITPEIRRALQDWGHATDGDECADAALLEVLAAAPVPPAAHSAPPDGWQPIETATKNGSTLLLGRFNECGKWRTMRGQWFAQAAIDDEWEDPDGFEAGWYETAVEPDAPNCWAIAPTHWMPLPIAPVPPAGSAE